MYFSQFALMLNSSLAGSAAVQNLLKSILITGCDTKMLRGCKDPEIVGHKNTLSELNDLSEDLNLLGLHDSLELLTINFGLASDLFFNESMLIGVVELDISYIFFASDLFALSESMERRTRVFESELTDERADLFTEKSRESDLIGVLGLTERLDGFESGPIVSPELKDLLLSGVFGLFASDFSDNKKTTQNKVYRKEDTRWNVYNHLYVCLANGVLHSVAFEDVNAVQTIEDIELHLESLGIVDIAKDAFLEVSNSSALYIRDNQLSTISRHYFADLDQLTYLDLRNNSIAEIEDGAFAKLRSLETLLLDCNNITAFRAGTWKGLADLRELYATNNNVVLRRNVFRGLRHLETLALDCNEIAEVPIGTFNGLPHIDLLYLSRNKISSLHPEVFRGLGEVNELDLGRNRLRDVSGGIFRHLKNLNSLWLNGNQIDELKADTFAGLDNLLLLFLNSNELHSVDMSAFAKMRNVTIDPGFKVAGTTMNAIWKVQGRFRCNNVEYQLPYECAEIESRVY
ncbi:Leucine-rich repeat-containing protein 15 [Melipona quadrifasciata]|uniref:Leucine-rich repeat-containing protein 15 n=1 Tax=Melipona quadrifasciata TaxID=166423 RepID=A0A0M8ZS06_9HYME|nr:Leucine-rich repeat-containing protein 15 [Melipona quadrifasciata]